VANLFYRNTNAKISFEVLDLNNNLVGLSSTSTVFYYIKTPDNYIQSNDPNVGIYTYANGIGAVISNPVFQDTLPGMYYINYVLSKVGEYKYKFQVNDIPNSINLAVSGDIKVITDGIF
jgi:hypothetical protein